jgi:branched-chain amino acid transport system substrate-binding protein
MKMLKFIPVFTLMILLLASGCKHSESSVEPVSQTNIRLGVLLSLTGSGSSTGQNSGVSVELARQDINAWLASIGRNISVTIVVADTKTDTAEALKQLKLFFDQGFRFIIGPYSSAEVAAIKSFADTHGTLIVSPSSVAVSLAIPGDNIFRFVSSDVIQGQAMTKMLLDDSIRVIIPLIRNDVWGNDLLGATGKFFTNSGGILGSPVKYDPATTDFSASFSLADAQVADLLTSYKAADIAVYLCSFGEGTRILASAGNYSHLKSISWYGSSAFAQNASLVADTAASGFAFSHFLPCPIFGLDEGAKDKWQPLKDRIRAGTGHDPDVYALTAYDAVWVGVQTCLATGADPGISTFKAAFIQESANYYGVSGNTTLDTNGDRASGNYDFWAVSHNDSGFHWQIVATYNSSTGTLIRW